jgi:hypothetical protein
MTAPSFSSHTLPATLLVPWILLGSAGGGGAAGQELPRPGEHAPGPQSAPQPREGELLVDGETRTLRLAAWAQGTAFLNSLPPDHQYHALVQEGGSAATKALFVTRVNRREVARALRELGAEDGGGVPLAAWNLRWVPLVPQPTSRVGGSALRVQVEWQGAERPYDLEELLADPGGEGVDMRFGGNEEHDEEWSSGCIMCLFSCPGGVVSNAAYTIRDHQRSATSFEPVGPFPADGARVVITLTLSAPG